MTTSQSAQVSSVLDESHLDIYQQFAVYPFDSDPIFLEGLAGILNSAAIDGLPEDEREYVIGRAKAFYFTKTTGKAITWEDYIKHIQPSATATSHGASDVSVPPEAGDHAQNAADLNAKPASTELSFAEISALIQSGKTHLIPNNDVIPGGLNEAIPSESRVPMRKKPWEDDLDINSESMNVLKTGEGQPEGA